MKMYAPLNYFIIRIYGNEDLALELTVCLQDDDDYVDDLPVVIQNKNKGPRSSVSAEAFGNWNKKSAFQAKVVPKSQETKDKILTRLGQAFMFSALDDKEKQIVLDAMEERRAV